MRGTVNSTKELQVEGDFSITGTQKKPTGVQVGNSKRFPYSESSHSRKATKKNPVIYIVYTAMSCVWLVGMELTNQQ